MRSLLPDGACWAAFGIARWEFPIVAQALSLAGNVRVGLAAHLYLSQGEFASNAQLVEKAVRIVRELGADIAEPARAAEMLRDAGVGADALDVCMREAAAAMRAVLDEARASPWPDDAHACEDVQATPGPGLSRGV